MRSSAERPVLCTTDLRRRVSASDRDPPAHNPEVVGSNPTRDLNPPPGGTALVPTATLMRPERLAVWTVGTRRTPRDGSTPNLSRRGAGRSLVQIQSPRLRIRERRTRHFPASVRAGGAQNPATGPRSRCLRGVQQDANETHPRPLGETQTSSLTSEPLANLLTPNTVHARR